MSWTNTKTGPRFEGLTKLEDGTEIEVTARVTLRTDSALEIQFYVAARWSVHGTDQESERFENFQIEESGLVTTTLATWKEDVERATGTAATRCFERLKTARSAGP